MSVLRETVLAVPALVLFLLISNALLGPDEHERIGSPVTTATSWIGADPPPAERWLAKDSIVTGGPQSGARPPLGGTRFARVVTPGARIRGVFAQFVPGESGRAI